MVLKIRLKFLAYLLLALILLMLDNNNVFAQQIILDGNTRTNLSTSGTTTDVTTQTIKNNNAFNSFKKFNVDKGNTVNLVVPSKTDNLINLIHDEKTDIEGTLNSVKNNQIGGNVFLVNPHGITVGKEGSVNVGSLTAVTPTTDYMNNFFESSDNPDSSFVEALLNADVPINNEAEIKIEGNIKAIESVRLDAGYINNEGEISTGNNFEVTTQDIINTEGVDDASDCTIINGEIHLVAKEEVITTGKISADQSDVSTAGSVEIKAGKVISMYNESEITAKGGGDVSIEAKFVSVGGTVDVSGETGGNVELDAYKLSLAGNINAKGSSASGGNINIHSEGKIWETTSSHIDASGASGGSLIIESDQQITTSGEYKAIGTEALGGNIDVTAPSVKFLSTKIDASGKRDGGTIRLGGEYQGGKNLEEDEIPNAKVLTMTDATEVRANSTGMTGDGGTIITWADEEAIVLGQYSATPGSESGEGGFVEISSGNKLTFGGTVETSIGNRTGTVLFDPKNITIADVSTYNQYSIIIGYNYDEKDATDIVPGAFNGEGDHFGCAVSIGDGNLAIGVYGDDDWDDDLANSLNSGAVYLYSFLDDRFSSTKLENMIGDTYGVVGYTTEVIDAGDRVGRSVSLDTNVLAIGLPGDNTNKGGAYIFTFDDSKFTNLTKAFYIGTTGDYNETNCVAGDEFGTSVAIDGTRLVVGANGDDGFGDARTDSGAVYLYTFDSNYSTITFRNIIGDGGYGIPQTLDNTDMFGGSVSLEGQQLAVGAFLDDGSGNTFPDSGSVYLFTFQNDDFTGTWNLEGTMGAGYSGGKNVDVPVTNNDQFGINVSLDNNRIAVGAIGDDGSLDSSNDTGAVYLYSFTDNTFSGANQEAIIGYEYSGGNNIHQSLQDSDYFGMSVSLKDNFLAVGAEGDDGYGQPDTSSNDYGSVYIYSFDGNTGFNNGKLEYILGNGYTGCKNINQDLDNDDAFGRSGISIDANQLAIGAHNDDDDTNTSSNTGAVYLYTFSDGTFKGIVLESIIGDGYTGGKNVSIALDDNDYFGYALSLDSNRLAVGAYGDDGNGNPGGVDGSGAVYLFSFTDSYFSNCSSEGIIGSGYGIDPGTLEADDYFGCSVSLDNQNLVIAADADDGDGNGVSSSGAAYLYHFTNMFFMGPTHVGTIGDSYSGGDNVDVTLDASDQIGLSCSLDGRNLVLGADGDDGFGNSATNTGAVYMFQFADDQLGRWVSPG